MEGKKLTKADIHKGQDVMCNGYPGFIREICDGPLDGMVEVELRSGTVCVDISQIEPTGG